MALSNTKHWPLERELVQVLGRDHVITDSETQKPYECDGLSMYCEQPMLVVLPGSAGEVRKVVQLCHRHNVPLVSRGAGTGLSAGAMPNKDGVLLSLARLDEILEIDPQARTARVQPGVRNASISEAANEFGLYYAPDPSSQIACTIGGNVAENSGGIHCLKYGLTVHNLVQITFLTAEGNEVVLGNPGLEHTGFDLMALLTGSEGLLGIVTEVVVRLLPRPVSTQVVVAAFGDLTTAANAVGSVIAAGIIPAGLEMMDHYAIVAAEDYCNAGYPKTARALLLCELDGSDAEVADYCGKVTEIFEDNGAFSIRVSQSEEERQLLWKGRKAAFPAVGRISPDYYCMDGTIPRGKLAEVLNKMSELSDVYELRVANVFHAGDGNLHPLILFDPSIPGEFEKTERFGAEILEMCVAVGGSITGEHGVGLEKIRQMPVQFGDAEISMFHAIKHCFDTSGMLNPGKGIPLLKNCQEYRARAKYN